jgi:hypothetical protein
VARAHQLGDAGRDLLLAEFAVDALHVVGRAAFRLNWSTH